jgi:glyoxylase-like metal-dependent hydrolase (beta-lactamase superfamily II)
MKIHHLNCGTLRSWGGRLIDGEPGVRRVVEMALHCLIVETDAGLVLIDTATGLRGVHQPQRWLGPGFLRLFRPLISEQETAVRQIERLGFSCNDVRHIVPTHLDLDHAGGIADFPNAAVHVFSTELAAAMNRRGALAGFRFRPEQFAHHPKWSTYREEGQHWLGFDNVQQMAGLPTEILLVPLHGHTPGHAGVAVDTGDGWVLHAGDAYMHHGEVDAAGPHCPRLIDMHQSVMATASSQRRANRDKLQELNAAHSDVTIFCAHSAVELRRSQTASL